MATSSPSGAAEVASSTAATLFRHPGVRPSASIPIALTPFIGREAETAQLCQLIDEEGARLVTLTGPGGVGKTRLAIQVATVLRRRFPDGVGFADLAILGPDQPVLPVLAEALGYWDPPDSLPLNKLTAFVADQRKLVIVDNFEHLMPRAGDIAALLSSCPNLVVLLTSRVVLRISGEREFVVAPLELEADSSDSLEAIASSPAVRLFVDRARAARSDFELTVENAGTVVNICRRLDGLPLAIELAAARVRALPVEGLEARLDQRLEMLARGPRDYPERQQTMRCTIGWSYDLLGSSEQRLFSCFSVFAGGCTLNPLESLAVEYGYSPASAFDAISALVEASLVVAEGDSPDDRRYRMLDTVRDYAAERLQQSTFAESTPQWHARYFHDLVQKVAPPPFEPSDRALVAPIEVEMDNIRAALTWMDQHGEGTMLLETASAMYDAWYYRGHFDECERWMKRALDLAPNDAPETQRAWVHKALAMISQIKGNESAAREHYTESLDLYACCGDRRARAIVNNIYAGFLVGTGHYDDARPVFEQNQRYFEGAGDDVWHSHALFHLGVIAFGQEDYAAAMAHCREAVEIYDRTGGHFDAIDPLRYVMLAAVRNGDLPAARLAGLDNLQRLRERGSLEPIAGGIADTAAYAAAKREWETAALLLGAAASVRASQGATFTLPARASYDHAEQISRRRLGDDPFEEAWNRGGRMGAMESLDAAVRYLQESGRANRASAGSSPLTDREQDVLRLLATGASNPEIAEELFISRGTVRTHVSSILGKLNVHTRTEAVSRAHREGWI